MIPTAGKVVDIVQGVLGHHVTSVGTARRHLKAIEQLLSLDLSPEQKAILEGKKYALEARWGGARGDGTIRLETNDMSPAVWLATRRFRERDFYSLKYAGEALLEGQTSLTKLMVRSLAKATHVMSGPVSLQTFRLWLLRTGVATQAARGRYVAGPNAERLSKMNWADIERELEAGGSCA